ncbi:MAG TPA: PKD domain-containing protein [Bacteroidales bacterium]|nr:PKD domain-containing protein [Bacteroidales bacterium]
MRILISLFLVLISAGVKGQDCTITAKANNITPDKLCSPVTVSWNVSYTGVNDAGSPVGIKFEWDDGTIETVPAVRLAPGTFHVAVAHSYTSKGDKCNYRPRASLIVNGVVCSSSTQQQIVTVWDDDDHNGGDMHIDPEIYPVCFGNSANVRFRDLTRFNCVPPQEKDVPNLYTRWIQWIYGTDNTMTGAPVKINGSTASFPHKSSVITLPGPVAGSGVYSEIINVDADKLIGQYFEVTLRNWNYCNPYDDPGIPGPPADSENGDHPPVVTRAKILIVAYPDATINKVDTLCIESSPVVLTAHDAGGSWSGPGVSGSRFNPSVAGTGNHTIRYRITNKYGCSDADSTVITVMPPPVTMIKEVEDLFVTDPPVTLEATPAPGSWSGTGVSGAVFNPLEAEEGKHVITYITIPDIYGCRGKDTIHINVKLPPLPLALFAPDTAGCSPFTVHFRNMSVYGKAWVWDFGDKTYSTEKEPVHTYHVPGNYIVKLTATNYAGESIARHIVTVYQGPSAMFEVYPPEVINNSQVVIFTNYSVYGSQWLWSFGDGKTSSEEAPWHKYDNEGNYTVSLKVQSADGCLDSAIYRSAIKVEYKPGEIRFPNAFRWNQTGPTGGYWNEGGLTDEIFRPFFTNVTDYYLQVFNRWGVLIYESRDIYKGWDGYFGPGNLAIQGVYVWKVTGQYADGSYFEKIGDVTFLH